MSLRDTRPAVRAAQACADRRSGDLGALGRQPRRPPAWPKEQQQTPPISPLRRALARRAGGAARRTAWCARHCPACGIRRTPIPRPSRPRPSESGAAARPGGARATRWRPRSGAHRWKAVSATRPLLGGEQCVPAVRMEEFEVLGLGRPTRSATPAPSASRGVSMVHGARTRRSSGPRRPSPAAPPGAAARFPSPRCGTPSDRDEHGLGLGGAASAHGAPSDASTAHRPGITRERSQRRAVWPDRARPRGRAAINRRDHGMR